MKNFCDESVFLIKGDVFHRPSVLGQYPTFQYEFGDEMVYNIVN